MKYTGINNYWINEFGEVTNQSTGKIIKHSFNKKNGYLSVKLSDNGKIHTVYVHRLMAKCYHLSSQFIGADVNHKDGDKRNNYYGNLEWVTRAENINHSFKIGLSNTKGERNSQSKLKLIQVIAIKDAIRLGHNRSNIAAYFKVHSDTIRSIERGKNWSYV